MKTYNPERREPPDNTGKFIFTVCSLFIFTTFILTIVATCGSTSNYRPINEIYVSELDISHINVTKLLPQITPVLTILAAAMKAPNASYDEIFSALKTISESEALTPLMSVLSNSTDGSATLSALEELAPLAVNGNSSSTGELTEIYQLLESSNNSTQELNSLSSLLVITSKNSTAQDSKIYEMVFNILAVSENMTDTVNALYSLNEMSQQDMAQFSPVLDLLDNSENITTTVSILGSLIETQINYTMAESLFSTLSQSTDIESTLQSLEQSVSGVEKQVITELTTLVSTSSNPTEDLSTLKSLIVSNVTSSDEAQKSFTTLAQILSNSENATLALATITELANSTDTSTVEELSILSELFTASNNETLVLSTLVKLQSTLQDSDASKSDQIEALFELLYSSKNPVYSFKALLELTAIAQNDASVFIPVLSLLDSAASSNVTIQDLDIEEIMPDVLQYLGIAERFRLGIFSHCRVDSSGKVLSCSNPYAVQSLDMKSLLYSELESSDFRPYLNALDIREADINLVGKLPTREHEYEPSMKAVLAMNILTIVFAFFLVILMLMAIFGYFTGKISKWVPPGMAMSIALFSFLGSIIVVVITGVIKDGTAEDGYYVIEREGTAYYGLVWTSFALSFISMLLLVYNVLRKGNNNKEAVEIEEDTSSILHKKNNKEVVEIEEDSSSIVQSEKNV